MVIHGVTTGDIWVEGSWQQQIAITYDSGTMKIYREMEHRQGQVQLHLQTTHQLNVLAIGMATSGNDNSVDGLYK